MKMRQCMGIGTCIFTWHDGNDRYDEVAWDPGLTSALEAAHLAEAKLKQDGRATRVQVEYGEDLFAEAVRQATRAA